MLTIDILQKNLAAETFNMEGQKLCHTTEHSQWGQVKW